MSPLFQTREDFVKVFISWVRQQFRAGLTKPGPVIPHKVNTDRTSGEEIIIEVTETGCSMLNYIGVQANRPKRRGGFSNH